MRMFGSYYRVGCINTKHVNYIYEKWYVILFISSDPVNRHFIVAKLFLILI